MKPSDKRTDLPQIIDEPGMAERFQRGLKNLLNTPPKHRSKGATNDQPSSKVPNRRKPLMQED